MGTLQKIRLQASKNQQHKCYYCKSLMWVSGSAKEFSRTHNINSTYTLHLQCTAEHLMARQDGGNDSVSNIVAACKFCNQGRHNRKTAPTPSKFREYVSNRLCKGKWNATYYIS